MSELFNTYLYQPILTALIFIYQNFAFHDLGLAIIILTLVVRVVLFPIFYKGAKDQAVMQRLQPHIKKIQLDHKDNKEKQAKELLALYRKHNFNPFSGFFLLIVQLPILIAIYQVFIKGLTNSAFDNLFFLGLINLGEKNLALTVVAATLQYFQIKISLPSQKDGKSTNPFASAGKMMLWLGPGLTVIILSTLPSALALYWTISVVFSIGQQVFINRRTPPIEEKYGESSSKTKNTA
jgi:YidC/Oxa1 family membrane protein insertase